MTATGSQRHEGRNWTTGVVYCDEPSDPANLGPLPISTLPKHATMQTWLTRIETDIVNVEMETDDGGRIPAQYQDCRILVRYKDYVDVCSKDMPTLAPHLSRHAMGIREEERFGLEERRKSVRGNGKVTRP